MLDVKCHINMSGHSKWTQIKHKKAITDSKKSKIFSKIVRLISIAAKENPDPKTNNKLRDAVLKAREVNMPKENIDRAIKKSAEEKFEELIIESWAPYGVALIIEALTDSRNRTIAAIKRILSDHNAKMGTSGSVKWMFDFKNGEYLPKNPITISEEQKIELEKLFETLDEDDDVKEIYSNLI